MLPPKKSGAQFSPCRTYRYALWRFWEERAPAATRIAFIGLNPSTADETEDDPTVRRCITFAQRWGYTGMYMLNAYGFRATDPKDMQAAIDPLGPGNLDAMKYYRTRAGMFIAAWGVHCPHDHARKLAKALGRPLQCFGLTKDGHPKHPLYLPATASPRPYFPRKA